MRLNGFSLKRFSHVRGGMAREFGEAFEGIVRMAVDRQNKKLPKQINKALAKQKDSAEFKSAWQYLQQAGGESHYQQYYLYYGAQAYFHASPDAWRKWNAQNIKSLAATQNKDGSWDGSFGNSFGTAASLLSLALNYRFLPIYER